MRRRPLSLFDKSSDTLFRDAHTWEALVAGLRDLRLEKNELIQAVAVGSHENLRQLLSEHADSGLRRLAENGDLSLFEYQRRFGRDNQHKVVVRFAVTKPSPEPISLFLFVAHTRQWRHGILPLIESLYPRAARPFLTQQELHTLLRNLQRSISPQGLRVLEFSSKKRLAALARKRFQSVREWTDADLDSVFKDARERNVWFRSVSFDVVAEKNGQLNSTGVHGQLSKYGYFSCSGGFEIFEKTVIRQLLQIGAERLKFFSDRGRSSTPYHSPRPLQIQYETDIFRSADQPKRLVEAMRRIKHGTCTVLHANPYIHLSVVDNVDYSSADLWVLSQNQILIVPQLKASEAALKRIVNHVFEHFSEGSISEFQDQLA